MEWILDVHIWIALITLFVLVEKLAPHRVHQGVAALCREIFGSRPSPKSRRPNARAWALALLVVAAAALVIFAAPQVHRIYYDEDIYANVGQNIALTHQAAMCNYGTFEYGEITAR